jgi:hypothetical protein
MRISAEYWDLAKPLQTCGLQVERRDNDLYLLFTTENHTKLFALAKTTTTCQTTATTNISVESVMDSSRYFVTHIQENNNSTNNSNNIGKSKSAIIGFGFRDRDVAIDLLGTLQEFQNSIRRELQAKAQTQNGKQGAEIPKLQQGEKIHITFGGGKNKTKKSTTMVQDNKDGGGGEDTKPSSNSTTTSTTGPLVQLLKKPPRFTPEEGKNIRLSTREMNLEADHPGAASASTPDSEQAQAKPLSSDDNNENDDDDDDWNDFQQATTSHSS